MFPKDAASFLFQSGFCKELICNEKNTPPLYKKYYKSHFYSYGKRPQHRHLESVPQNHGSFIYLVVWDFLFAVFKVKYYIWGFLYAFVFSAIMVKLQTFSCFSLIWCQHQTGNFFFFFNENRDSDEIQDLWFLGKTKYHKICHKNTGLATVTILCTVACYL